LHIPEGRQMLLTSKKVKEYKIKGLIHALPEKIAQNRSWYLKFLDSAQKIHSNSVRPSTKITYSTGQKRWFVVVELIGTDSLIRMIPKEWEIRKDLFKLSTLTWRESSMLAFLASCRDPQKAVIPSTAFAYLSAVRKFLEDNGIDTDFFENLQYIRNTKAGMVNAYRAELNRDKPSRLAITVDMIVGSDIQTKKQLGEKYGLVQLAVHTAQLSGYTTLSRVSEYLQVPGEAGALTPQ
jgi:hypothetical protein